jgi:hypothetical protein
VGIFPDIFTEMAVLLLLAAAVGALAATPANIHNIDSSQGVNTNDDTNAILRSCWRGERFLSSLASRQSTYRLIYPRQQEGRDA